MTTVAEEFARKRDFMQINKRANLSTTTASGGLVRKRREVEKEFVRNSFLEKVPKGSCREGAQDRVVVNGGRFEDKTEPHAKRVPSKRIKPIVT